ncbi:FAD-dependent oxidoreductase [Mesotoga sp. Brook.08.YT.4.2.5.1]|uniref:NAD(P)/FAD-dependent oxidoreductase n=1 Tax=unclassified Mesotoga TaxID=1184398 RepID=UPI000C192AAA|nr:MULTISPECIES: FAD-binding oxidoreductase [unclassified Mesotoga]PNE23285.1 FAD-dependent oxidoreductase [Mesotoga sp. Brook.08.YT.4.2.5.1]PNS37937.1 FAD-dependent oxidoreductase [Mesotoga sp. B105.6.4]RDI91242.1 FAD-dependent oxidoreductase [Mesotoga sp. Brook.08.YT.4.2.5.2.]
MIVKSRYKVVVIGGGVIGTAVAFYLAKNGVSDVVVLEKDYLSSGSTGRCGGGIRQQWSERMNVRLAMRSVEHFKRFESEVGFDIEYFQGGYLLLAYTEEEVLLFERNTKMQQEENLDVELLSKNEASSKFSFIDMSGVRAAAYCSSDGHANPHLTTFAYARAAERMGVEILTHTSAENIITEDGRIVAVQTSKGKIETEVVVNAAGGYSHEVGAMAGVELPTESYRHQIFVTEPLEHIMDPLVISFENNFYIRQTKAGNFIMGQGDKDELPGHNVTPTWKFLREMTEKMPKFFPFLRDVRVLRHWAGLYNMSPDAQPIIDRAVDIDNFYYAIGFSGHGFMLAPAVGEAVAEWIVHGEPRSVDISNLSLNRFQEGFTIEKNVV